MSNRPKVANIAEVYPSTIKEVLYECLLPAIAKKNGLHGPAACSAILQAAKLLQTDIDELASLPPEPVPTEKNKAKVPSTKRTRVGRPPKSSQETPAWPFVLRILAKKGPLIFSDLAPKVHRQRKAGEQMEVTTSTIRAALSRLCRDEFVVRGEKKRGANGTNRSFLYEITDKGQQHFDYEYPSDIPYSASKVAQKGSKGMRTS